MFFGGKRGEDNKLLIVLFLLIGALIVGILFYDVTSSFSRDDEAKRVYYVFDNAMLMDTLSGAPGNAIVKYPFDLISYELDIEDDKLVLTDQRDIERTLRLGDNDDSLVKKEADLAIDASVDIKIGDIDEINHYKKVSDVRFSTGSRFTSRGYVCEMPNERAIDKIVFDPIYGADPNMNTFAFIFKNTFASSSAGYNFYTSRSQNQEIGVEERKAFVESVGPDFYLSTKAAAAEEDYIMVYYPAGDMFSRYIACRVINAIAWQFDTADGAAMVPVKDFPDLLGREKDSIMIELSSPDWENSIFSEKTYDVHVSIIEAFDSVKPRGEEE